MPAKPSRNLHQRLHAAMGKVKYIQKDARVKLKSGASYSVITHDAVTAKVRPALLEQGVIYYPVGMHRTQDGNRTEVDLKVRFANIDDPTDYIDVPGTASAIDNEDKGPGKAVSYAVKYCLLKALGLETGEDADLASGEVAKVDPRAGAGIPPPKAPTAVALDLVSPDGEIEGTYSDPQKYMTELANQVKDDGNYWMENVLNVDWIEDNFPQYKKWVRKLRKLGTTAHDNALEAKRVGVDDLSDAGPQFAEEDVDLTKSIPPNMDQRPKFQLISPGGIIHTFTDPKKLLQTLEDNMLSEPVFWWEPNCEIAKLIAEDNPELQSWVDGLLDMAVEAGKDNPLGAG